MSHVLKPWTVSSSRIVHQDRWIRLRADDCRTGDGVEIKPYYVLEYTDWSHVLAIDEAGRAIMVRQYRHGRAAFSLELPGGVVDVDERDPLVAARRELLEETGYAADKLFPAGSFAPNPSLQTNLLHVFVAPGARPVAPPQREPGETLEVERIAIADLAARSLDGGLINGVQIAAVQLALRRYRELA